MPAGFFTSAVCGRCFGGGRGSGTGIGGGAGGTYMVGGMVGRAGGTGGGGRTGDGFGAGGGVGGRAIAGGGFVMPDDAKNLGRPSMLKKMFQFHMTCLVCVLAVFSFI